MEGAVVTSAVVSRAQRSPLTHGDQVAAFLRMMQVNVLRTFGVWVVLGTAAFAILFISQTAVTDVVLWNDYSYDVGRTFLIIGPIFAIWTAILAQRDSKPTRMELLASTASLSNLRELRMAIAGVLLALLSYGIVAAAVLGYAATRATWGGPDLWIVGFGAAMTGLFALVGWLMGTLFPSRITPFIPGLATLLYTTISYTWGPATSDLSALQPYRYVVDSGGFQQLFYEFPRYPGAPHPGGGLLLAIGMMGVLVATYLLWRKSLGAVIPLALAAALLVPGWIVATDVEHVERLEAIPNVPMVCAGEVVELCLHQAYEAQLDDGVAFADAFYEPVAGLAGVPEVVTQQPFGQSAVPMGTVPLDTFWTNSDIENAMAMPMVQALFPSPTWLSSEGYDSEYDHTPAQAAIRHWLVQQAGGGAVFPFEFVGVEPPDLGLGYDGRPAGPSIEEQMQAHWDEVERIQVDVNAAAERFAALSADEQRSWLEANWDALRSGELTLEDLP